MLRTQGSASRAEIARALSVTPATVTRMVSSLLARKLVIEVKATESVGVTRDVGRPGIEVTLNPEGAYFFGTEIDVGTIRCALLNLALTVVASLEIRVSKNLGPEGTVHAIGDYLDKLKTDTRFRGRILSVGVTVPGLVATNGYVFNLPILGWRDVQMVELVAKMCNLPCVVENDANAAAFGTFYTQLGLPNLSTIFLRIGTGCGGAAIINGRILRGALGTACEFGHVVVSEHGRRCSCGQIGCLETWVNLAALARFYDGRDELTETEFIDLPARVAREYRLGQADACRAVNAVAGYIAKGLIALINVFNPSLVVLGGVMAPVLECCLPLIVEQIGRGVVPGVTPPAFQLSELGSLECAIGAASVGHHHTYDISNLDLAEAGLKP